MEPSDKKDPEDENTGLPAAGTPEAEAEEQDQIGMGLSDADIDDILGALNHEDGYAVEIAVGDLSPADAADLLSKISDEDRRRLLEDHADAIDPETYAELSPELRRDVLSDMPALKVAAIIAELDSDDALYLISNLDPDFQREIIRKLSAKTRLTLEEGLSFPEESAGRLMQREFVAIPQFWTVGKTIDYLRAAADDLPDEFFDIFVITPTYEIAGEIPLNRLVRARRSEKLEHLKLEETHPIPADMDQEDVARMFRRENLVSAPVVDREERLIGVITIDDVVDVIHTEAQEDLLKMGGVGSGDLYGAVLSTTGSRFRWLFVNLLTAVLASWVISFFGATIQEVVALAILMPIVASMGGNAGTQALTVAVRALATRELSRANAMRVIWKEVLVGTLNGAAFAVIAGLIAAWWFANPVLGAVIGAAMVINLIFAGLCGAAIPLVVQRFGSDPAVSSTVILTTVTDVIGFFAFLGLASLFLM